MKTILISIAIVLVAYVVECLASMVATADRINDRGEQ